MRLGMVTAPVSRISCRKRQCSDRAHLDLYRIYFRAEDTKAEWVLLITELIHFTTSQPVFPSLISPAALGRPCRKKGALLQFCNRESQGGADIECPKLLSQVIQDQAYLTPQEPCGFGLPLGLFMFPPSPRYVTSKHQPNTSLGTKWGHYWPCSFEPGSRLIGISWLLVNCVFWSVREIPAAIMSISNHN